MIVDGMGVCDVLVFGVLYCICSFVDCVDDLVGMVLFGLCLCVMYVWL